jgi:hypothetical protein
MRGGFRAFPYGGELDKASECRFSWEKTEGWVEVSIYTYRENALVWLPVAMRTNAGAISEQV